MASQTDLKRLSVIISKLEALERRRADHWPQAGKDAATRAKTALISLMNVLETGAR